MIGPIEFAVDGHDGAGKTPIVLATKAALEALGLRVAVESPFHLANALYPGGEIYPLWADDASVPHAIALLQQVVRYARLAAVREDVDVIIFDRHWMTVMIEIHGRPCEALWDDFVPTFFVRAIPEKTEGCSRFSPNIPWTSTPGRVREYNARYLAMAEAFAPHVLAAFDVNEKRVPLEPIVERIVTVILERRH